MNCTIWNRAPDAGHRRSEDGPRLKGSRDLDSSKLQSPCIVRLPSGGYRLFYTAVGPAKPYPNCQGYILSAVSEDGLNFQKEPGIRVAPQPQIPHMSLRVISPSITACADGRWRMYFESRGSADIPTVICSAVSSDILHWTFGIRTVFAVLGSCGSQLILKGDFLGMLNVTPIPQPWSYVILFGVSCPAMWLSAVLVQMAQVPPVPGEDSESPAGLQWKEILSGLKSFFLNPLIMAAAVGFQLTYNGAMVMNTISLYARETLGEAPEKGAGIQLALQPGFRWLMGFGSGIIPTLLGLVSDRYSLRASFVAAIGILVLALILVQTRLPKQPTDADPKSN